MSKITTYEQAHESMESLQARQSEIEAAHQKELDKLIAERERLGEIRQPFNELCGKVDHAETELANAAQQREVAVRYADQYLVNVEAFIGRNHEFTTLYTGVASCTDHQRRADEIIAAIDRWVPQQKAKIAELKKERAEYAKANGLTYLLQ